MTQSTPNRTAQAQSLAALIKAQQATGSTASPANNGEKRPAPVLYLNIGYEHPTLGRINLPFNLPLDTMNLRDLKGTDEWKVKATLSNQLLEGLREQVAQLETGPDGAVIVEGLTVEAFHRRIDDAPADASDLAAAMSQVPQFTLRKA